MNLTYFKLPIALLTYTCIAGCMDNQFNNQNDFIESNLMDATTQVNLQIKVGLEFNRIPRSQNSDGSIQFTNGNGFDWTEGFFPGICWKLYSVTNDEKYKKAAQFFQNKIKEHRHLTTNHDLGFVFNNSYGAGYRITKNEEYRQVLIDAGNSLIQRYSPAVGCLKSWDIASGWQSARNWDFPVIIDTMMNLELLFELTEITGDPVFRQIAINHANTTLKNHFREDFSSYHVVDYNSETGEIRSRETAQGYAHESAWSRGQAWGLYGYTVCYRYTKDPVYLVTAEKIAAFILSNPHLPKDQVPYWDFNAPKIPDELRDASSAAIMASALIELDGFSEQNFLNPARKIIESLSTSAYKAETGKNSNFILMHSVGSIPHGAEIDVPLVYADYYYIEALIRLGALNEQLSIPSHRES